MSSAGPNFVGSGVDLGAGWTSPGNVTAEDATSATFTSVCPFTTTKLRCTMGANAFSVAGFILGVLVEIKVSGADDLAGTVLFDTVTLVNGGVEMGTNQAAGNVNGTLTWYSFGGSSNLMGATLNDTIVNSSTFGVDIAFSDSTAGANGNISVDAVRITIYYAVEGPTVILKRRARQKDMGKLLKQNQTADCLYFWMFDSTDHVTGLTGLIPSAEFSKNGAAGVAASGAISQVDSTNLPGLYKIAGNATDSNTLGPLVLRATAAGADAWTDEWQVVAFDPEDAVRMGQSALPNANAGANGGVPTVDANNAVKLQTGTGANQISLTNGLVSLAYQIRENTAQAGAAGTITLDAGASATDDFYKDCWVELLSGTGAGQVRYISGYTGATKVAAVAPNWTVAPDVTSGFVVLPAAEVNASGGVTYPTNFSALAIDINGRIDLGKILGTALSETIAGQLAGGFKKWFDVTTPAYTLNNVNDAYTRIGAGGVNLTNLGDTRLAFLDAAVSSRLATVSYTAPLDAAGTAAAVLDVAASSHNTANTIGAKINSAASAGDPWATLLPGSYTAGEAGYILGNFLTADLNALLTNGTYGLSAIESLLANATFGLSALHVDITGLNNITADQVWAAATRTLTTIDKTGYKLASDGLDTVSTAAPAGVPANFREQQTMLYRRFFNKTAYNKTTGLAICYADDGTTVITTQTWSDDGTTGTQGAAA